MNNGVQIGLVRVDGSMEAGSRPPEYFAFWEKERYCRLRPGPAQTRFLTGRLLVRQLLSRHCQDRVAPSTWCFCENRYGKPLLDPGQHRQKLFFSLSYSGSLVLAAVSADGPVGVDVESLDQGGELHIQNVFSREEQAYLAALNTHDRRAATLAVWTSKEAVAKMTGLGFSLDFSSFSCLPLKRPVFHDPSRCPVRFQPEHIEIKRFFLSLPGGRYCCSLAVFPADQFFPAGKKEKMKKVGINISPIRLPVRKSIHADW